MKLVVSLFAGLFLLLHTAIATTGFKTEGVILYQPDEVLRTRLNNVESLANYYKKLEAVCTEFFAAAAQPETLDIVVAVKPGKHARVWFISSTRADDNALEPLRQKLEAVPALDVFSGPVVFAVAASIAGGDGKAAAINKKPQPPLPKEWTDAAKDAKGSLQIPDGFIALVWPDPPGGSEAVAAPEGFVNQVLEPTGGRIFRPKDWFYTEGHHGPVYMWTLSKEDTSGNRSYTTGMRLQLFSGLKQGAGKTPKEFILGFVEKKKKEAAKVLKSCEPKDQGLFTRMCLETEEGPYHILYSLFWGSDNLDMAVISISGTTKELWATYAPVFDRMSEFELIDMKRLEKEANENAARRGDPKPPMTRLEMQYSSPKVKPSDFITKPRVLYVTNSIFCRAEEQPDGDAQRLIIVHAPDSWFCDVLRHTGQHSFDHDPEPGTHFTIVDDGPPELAKLEFGEEVSFFTGHHATALPAQTVEGQECDASEYKAGTYRVVLFQRKDTHQPFLLQIFKDGEPDFSIRYLNYQTGLPFDAALFTPPKDITITEAKPKADK